MNTPKRRRTSNRAKTLNTTTAAEPVVIDVQQPVIKTEIAAPRQSSMQAERIGDVLRRAREQRRETIDAISEYLRIRPSYLEALESSHYEQLPADAYVIGFLRSYANYLDLDGKVAIDQYRREMAGRRRKPQLSMPKPISEGQAPSTPILIGAAVSALLLYLIWYGFANSDRDVATAPPPLPTTAQMNGEGSASVAAPAASNTASSTTPTSNTSAAKSGGEDSRVTLFADRESWVLVTDGKGGTIYDHILKAGESYKVPNLKGLQLTTGNAGGITVKLDGADLPKLGEVSRVARNIPLDPESLKNPLPISLIAPQPAAHE